MTEPVGDRSAVQPLPVRFTVWSDFLYLWCYVAAVRLDQLSEEVGDQVVVMAVVPVAARAARVSLEKFRAYTQSWLRPGVDGAQGELRALGESHDAQPSHSLPSAVAGKVAASFGPEAWDRYHLALMRAYFTDNRTISETEVQVDVVGECGLDSDEFARRLAEDGEALRCRCARSTPRRWTTWSPPSRPCWSTTCCPFRAPRSWTCTSRRPSDRRQEPEPSWGQAPEGSPLAVTRHP